MQRKIIRVGNSYGVIIPKSVLKTLDWKLSDLTAEINIPKNELVIKSRKK